MPVPKRRKLEKVNWIELLGVVGPGKILTTQKDIKSYLRGEINEEAIVDTDRTTYFDDEIPEGKEFLVGKEVVKYDA